MLKPEVNQEALKVRLEREDVHRHASKKREKLRVENRIEELNVIKQRLISLSRRAANIGESDLAEDILTCSKFAEKFRKKRAG